MWWLVFSSPSRFSFGCLKFQTCQENEQCTSWIWCLFTRTKNLCLQACWWNLCDGCLDTFPTVWLMVATTRIGLRTHKQLVFCERPQDFELTWAHGTLLVTRCRGGLQVGHSGNMFELFISQMLHTVLEAQRLGRVLLNHNKVGQVFWRCTREQLKGETWDQLKSVVWSIILEYV